MAVFAGFFMRFNKDHEARLAKVAADAELVRKEKARAEVAAREHAIKAAIEAQERRRQERDERLQVEEAKKKARQTAEDQRERAHADRKRLRDQSERLKKEVETVKLEVEKLLAERKAHGDEKAFLTTYVKQAEANVKYYYTLLDKLAAAEAARAAAAAAEAAGKKS
ncbi:MAG: hypothetical protein Q8J74_10705 [Candidatus Didemnitutus sp.]|nr:hypothetical protein [Candidatus Didemnitutus sp.]